MYKDPVFKVPTDQSDLYNAFRRTDFKTIFLFEQMRKLKL